MEKVKTVYAAIFWMVALQQWKSCLKAFHKRTWGDCEGRLPGDYPATRRVVWDRPTAYLEAFPDKYLSRVKCVNGIISMTRIIRVPFTL